MSTRSGKRIHGSFHENTLDGETENILNSKRKTRSRREKENGETLVEALSKIKKRKNYVSYPKDGDLDNVNKVPVTKETTRSLQKTALKEQNWNVSNTIEHIDDHDDKRPTRQTRYTRRVVEYNGEDAPPNNGIMLSEMEVEIKQTVKNKKNKKIKVVEAKENEQEFVKASKKKSKKKKKKSVQSQLDIKNSTQNNSNLSLDSFHSAAGSPGHGNHSKSNATFDKVGGESVMDSSIHDVTEHNTAVERKRPSTRNTTIEKINGSLNESVVKEKRYSTRNSIFETITELGPVSSSTFDKEDHSRKSNAKDSTFDKTDMLGIVPKKLNSTFETVDAKLSTSSNKLNTTFDKDQNTKRKSLRSSTTLKAVNVENDVRESEDSATCNGANNLNSTFDKMETQHKIIADSKCSLLSLDDNSNLTSDKSDDGSRTSFTSVHSRNGDLRTENIVNTTPMLIESSLDDSVIVCNTSTKSESSLEVKSAGTPMKREGTFTKDGPEISVKGTDMTPTKHVSISSPGSTPFPFSKSSQKEKCMLNVTRSLEKAAARKSFSIEPVSRTTRVMFCSPVNNPAVLMQVKGKVIKSNLKGSNKSFVFEDSGEYTTATFGVRASARKRSYTHNDVEQARVKRKRLADDQQHSVDRLSRPRTSSSAAKPTEPTTPSKKPVTPAKSKSDSKVSRTKLPNFAALHQRRFEKMESLDECQQRKAKRARQLLTPTGAVTVLQRSSPRGDAADSPTVKGVVPLSKQPKKTETPMRPKQPRIKPQPPPPDTFKPNLPTLESLKPGYTRFGFKMNTENPFSITNTVTKPKEGGPNGALTRQVTLPSLTGKTSARREQAKQTVMREKSFTLEKKREVKRNENRTIIKGVRTNRRFDLQMKMRNIS